MLHPFFSQQLHQVVDILKKHNVVRAYAFGSVCSDKFEKQSDIDLLIAFQDELDPLKKGQYIWDLEDKLTAIFHRKIDLITENSLKNPYFIKELNETKIPIYE